MSRTASCGGRISRSGLWRVNAGEINGRLRRMSDLETPETDMMRNHSSLDAAPATLRPEESQPGLDPDNPGAAPDTTRGHQRLAGLGRPVSDPVWDDAERVCPSRIDPLSPNQPTIDRNHRTRHVVGQIGR